MIEKGCHFIIKRNLRREGKEDWFAMAKKHCQKVTNPREGKTVYIGSDWEKVTYRQQDGTEKTVTIRTGYEIIERSIDKYGQCLFPNNITVNTW